MNRKFALKALAFLFLLGFAMMVAVPNKASAYDEGPEALRPVGRFLTAAFASVNNVGVVVFEGVLQAKFVTQPKKQFGLLASTPEYAVDRLIYAGVHSFSDTPNGEFTPGIYEIGAIQDWSMKNPWFNYGKHGLWTGAYFFTSEGVSWIAGTWGEKLALMMATTAAETAIFGYGLELLPN